MTGFSVDDVVSRRLRPATHRVTSKKDCIVYIIGLILLVTLPVKLMDSMFICSRIEQLIPLHSR